MVNFKEIEEDVVDAQENGELESIEDFEKRRLPLWMQITLWIVIFTLTSWSIAWFY